MSIIFLYNIIFVQHRTLNIIIITNIITVTIKMVLLTIIILPRNYKQIVVTDTEHFSLNISL